MKHEQRHRQQQKQKQQSKLDIFMCRGVTLDVSAAMLYTRLLPECCTHAFSQNTERMPSQEEPCRIQRHDHHHQAVHVLQPKVSIAYLELVSHTLTMRA